MAIEPGSLGKAFKEAIDRLQVELREELETAWLRGYRAAEINKAVAHIPGERQREAADYAERVVGGSTRPKRP